MSTIIPVAVVFTYQELIRTISSYKYYLLCLLLILSFCTNAYAHDWYSPACCSNHDCYPVPCDEVHELPKGFVQYHEHTFTPIQVHPSQDSHCHVCIHEYPSLKQPICVYTQQGS